VKESTLAVASSRMSKVGAGAAPRARASSWASSMRRLSLAEVAAADIDRRKSCRFEVRHARSGSNDPPLQNGR
jgi:hypothetical protein